MNVVPTDDTIIQNDTVVIDTEESNETQQNAIQSNHTHVTEDLEVDDLNDLNVAETLDKGHMDVNTQSQVRMLP